MPYYYLVLGLFVIVFISLLFYHYSNYKYCLEIGLENILEPPILKEKEKSPLIEEKEAIVAKEEEKEKKEEAIKPKKKMVIFSTIPSAN